MTPKNHEQQVMLAASKKGYTVFRNHVGAGYTGKCKWVSRAQLLISNPRRFFAGLCKGSSDFIGWQTVEITPDMVGKKVAVFTAIEAKAGTGRLSKEQRNFLDQVEQAGGVAVVAREEFVE